MAYGMNLQPANPVIAAVQGYKAVDDVFETNRQRKLAEEDRKRRISYEDQQRANAAEDRQRRIASQETAEKRKTALWEQKQQQFANENDREIVNSMRLASMQSDGPIPTEQYQALFGRLSPEGQKTLGSMYTPGASEHTKKDLQEYQAILEDFKNGDKFVHDKAVNFLNTRFSDEINQGGAREDVAEVVDKRVERLEMSPQGTIVPVIRVTGKDAEENEVSYLAPATKGQGAEDDALVNQFTLEGVQKTLQNRHNVAQALDAVAVSLGDNAPLKQAQDRQQGMDIAGAMGNLAGFTEEENAKLQQVAEAGGDVKSAVDILINKRKGAKVDLEWRDNVNVGGKPFQVAYDKKTGKEVIRIPQYVKGVSGSGGSGGSAADKMPKHVYDWFKTPPQYDDLGKKIADEGIDQQKLEDFVVFKQKYGRDMSYEQAMMQFIQQERSNRVDPPPPQPSKEDIDNIDPGELDKYWAGYKAADGAGKEEGMGYLDELSKKNPAMYVAITNRIEKENAPQKEEKPKSAPQGMNPTVAPERAKPPEYKRAKVLDYIDKLMGASTREFPERERSMEVPERKRTVDTTGIKGPSLGNLVERGLVKIHNSSADRTDALTRQPRMPGMSDSDYNALSGFDEQRFTEWAQNNTAKLKGMSTEQALLVYIQENPDQKEAVAKMMSN